MDNAVTEYRIALLLDPSYVPAHIGLGMVLEKLHKHDAAFEEIRAALRLDPQSADAHLGLGHSLEKKGKLQDALEEYSAALPMEDARAKYEKLSVKLGIKKQSQPLATQKSPDDPSLAPETDTGEKPSQAAGLQSSANEIGPLSRVKKDRKYSNIDRTGKMIIAPESLSAGPFSEGLACVEVGGKREVIERGGIKIIQA